MLVPRPYQAAAAAAVAAEFGRLDSTLVVMATGLGKTVTFGMVVGRWLADHPADRVLVLAHREELLHQARGEMELVLGFTPQLEMREARAWQPHDAGLLFDYGGEGAHRVVVASVQTLWQDKRLARFDPAAVGLVVIDEAHHCVPQNRMYERILRHFPRAKRLGVTASAERADQLALGQTFGSVAYEYGIRKAVEGGYLVPVEQHFVQVDSLDLTPVRTAGGDLHQGDLAKALTADERTSWQVAAATVKHFGDEPTLVFTCPRAPGEPHSQGEQVADRLNQIKPGSAVHLSGKHHPDVRHKALERFRGGGFQYLVGCDLFTEGFNEPRISRVVMARPTKSIVYYQQAVGRGTRPLRGVLTPDLDTPAKRLAAIAASAKPNLVVMDLVGNSGKHKLLSCVDIFAGDHRGPALARAKELAGAAVGQVKVADLLAQAADQVRREQEEAAAKKAATVRADVSYRVEEVDPFGFAAPTPAKPARNRATDPATASQIQWIKQNGGILPAGATVAAAGAVIAEIKGRRQHGLCSMKQQDALERRGLVAGAVPKSHAKALCDFLAAAGWPARVPPVTRRDLSIGPARETPGWRLRVRGVPVGEAYPTQDALRAAYEGLAREPQQVGAA